MASEESKGNTEETNSTTKLDFSFLDEWKEDWFCYWDDSYDMPFEPDADFNFRPLLETATSSTRQSFATSPAAQPFREASSDRDNRVLNDTLEELMRLRPSNTDKTNPGSEGGPCQFVPFLVSWSPLERRDSTERLLTPLALLEHLGAHGEICNTITAMDVEETLEGCVHLRSFFWSKHPDSKDHKSDDGDAHKKVDAAPTDTRNIRDPLIFYAGSGKLNPVPYFIVGRLSTDLVGGYLSSVVHT